MEATVAPTQQKGRRLRLGRQSAADIRSDAELERWLATGGVTATVVPACPDPGCAVCRPEPAYEAA